MALIEYKLDNDSLAFTLVLSGVGAQGSTGDYRPPPEIQLQEGKIPHSYLPDPLLASSKW